MSSESTVAEGELITVGGTPTTDLSYRLEFPDSQVFVRSSTGHVFRVTGVTEGLRCHPDGRIVYTVCLSGPRQFKKGGDSRTRDLGFFGNHWGNALSDLPAPVADYLHGEDRMRQMDGVAR